MGLILLLVVVGSLGYMVLEGWSSADSFYMSVITLSTVGYGEANELSAAGRIYTSILIICSMLVVTCWTAGITSMVVSGEFSHALYQTKANKMAKKSKEHTIVCGDGLFVEMVLRQLLFEDQKVVFLASDQDQIKKISKKFAGVPVIEGTPLDEDSLLAASIANASNLVAVMDSEHDNLLISMTAKELNEDLNVMAKADSDPVATRMRRCGIDGVISPLRLGANSISAKIRNSSTENILLDSQGKQNSASTSETPTPDGCTSEDSATLEQIKTMQTKLDDSCLRDKNATELATVENKTSVKSL